MTVWGESIPGRGSGRANILGWALPREEEPAWLKQGRQGLGRPAGDELGQGREARGLWLFQGRRGHGEGCSRRRSVGPSSCWVERRGKQGSGLGRHLRPKM